MATFGSGSESSQISQNCPSRRSFNPCHHCSELLEPQTIYRSHRVSSRRYSRASRRERGRHDFLLHSIAFAPKEACTVGSPIAPKPDSAPCYSTPGAASVVRRNQSRFGGVTSGATLTKATGERRENVSEAAALMGIFRQPQSARLVSGSAMLENWP